MYTLTPSVIALQRGMLYIHNSSPVEPGGHVELLVHTVQAELMNLGYMLDSAGIKYLMSASREDIIRFHDEVIAYLTYIKGDGDYRLLYDGFPQQVMEMNDVELFVNAIRHYRSSGEWVPNAYTQ